MYQAVCYAVVDVGTQQSKLFDAKKQIYLLFELPFERHTFERDGKKVELPRAISKPWGATLGKKAYLRRDLESWRGRPFTEEELKGFELKNLLGANCQLNIIHNEKNGSVYANIASVAPLAKGMAKMAPENPVLCFDLDEFLKTGAGNWPANLPEWLKAKIMNSDEYLNAMQVPGDPPATTNEPLDDSNPPTEDCPF